jgi:hypothetical protein
MKEIMIHSNNSDVSQFACFDEQTSIQIESFTLSSEINAN